MCPPPARRVGYTTGVFDLFHIGHLNILRKAREHCDYLIAGISTDELVQSYKNKLPVIPFEERSAIVSAIKYVDRVVAQEDRNKIAAWEKFRFNIMFVGDDWRQNELFTKTEAILRKQQVAVVYFPYTKGISSTTLSSRIGETDIWPNTLDDF